MSSPDAIVTPRSRRQLRIWWSLAAMALLVLILGTAIVAARYRQTLQFEAVVESAGGQVVWDPGERVESWTRWIVPEFLEDSFFGRPYIDFASYGHPMTPAHTREPGVPLLTDEDWLVLHEQLNGHRTHIVGIRFNGSDVGDRTAATLSEYPNLQGLDFTNTRFGDEGLRTVGGIIPLTILVLDHTSVSGNGLGYLERLENLRYLGVVNTGLPESARTSLEAAIPGLTVSDD